MKAMNQLLFRTLSARTCRLRREDRNPPDPVKLLLLLSIAGVLAGVLLYARLHRLADMPLIKDSNYEKLVPLLEGHDAVRPLCRIGSEKTPGHPVLHSSELKQKILGCPDDWTVSRILRMSDTAEPVFDDPSWAADVDDAEAYQALIRRTC